MQDIHVHVWDPALHFDAALVHETDLARGYPLDLTVRAEKLLSDMQPVERAAVFGIKARRNGYWVPDEFVADFVRLAPQRFVGFASCDPVQENCLAELRQAVDHLKMQGVKIGPTYAGIDPRDPRCEKIYAFCQSRGLPILFHTGTTYNRNAPLAYSRPWLWDEVAIKFPDLRMVLAHLGHPYGEECLVVIRKHPHLYADLAALYYRPWQFYNMLIAAQEYCVTNKLLFGSDYPFTTPADSAEGLRRVNRLVENTALPRVSAEVVEGILSRDALQLLGVPA